MKRNVDLAYKIFIFDEKKRFDIERFIYHFFLWIILLLFADKQDKINSKEKIIHRKRSYEKNAFGKKNVNTSQFLKKMNI